MSKKLGRTSGVTDHYAWDDEHALVLARRVVGSLNRSKDSQLAVRTPEEPLYSADEIGGIVGDNLKKTFDSKNIISRIVDGSRFAEFKEHYGTSLVTGKKKLFIYTYGLNWIELDWVGSDYCSCWIL